MSVALCELSKVKNESLAVINMASGWKILYHESHKTPPLIHKNY